MLSYSKWLITYKEYLIIAAVSVYSRTVEVGEMGQMTVSLMAVDLHSMQPKKYLPKSQFLSLCLVYWSPCSVCCWKLSSVCRHEILIAGTDDFLLLLVTCQCRSAEK